MVVVGSPENVEEQATRYRYQSRQSYQSRHNIAGPLCVVRAIVHQPTPRRAAVFAPTTSTTITTINRGSVLLARAIAMLVVRETGLTDLDLFRSRCTASVRQVEKGEPWKRRAHGPRES
jgi:hypothetical protein